MSLHKDFRPSGIEKCVLCPGCLKMCEGIPRTSSDAANEGTMLHDKVAHHSTEGLSSEQSIMVERCFELMDRLAPNGGWLHETTLTMNDEEFNEIVKGTADAIFIDGTTGILADWKYGYNPVTVGEDNWQLKTYATMMFQAYDIETCRCIIFQPRLGNKGFSEVTYSRDDLADFPEKLKEVYARTQDGLQLHADAKQCKYCDAKPVCPEYKRFTGQVSDALVSIEHTHELTNERLGEALMQVAQVKDFIKQLDTQVKAVENVARERLIKNEVTPDQIGYCLKTRKGARKCTDAQGVFNLLSEVISIDKFMSVVDISIPDLEALYGKEAKAKGLFKSQKDAVKDVGEKIAPYIERKSDSFTLEKLGE